MFLRHLSQLLLPMAWLLWSSVAMSDANKFALVVGNNDGAPVRQPLRFAEADAKKTRAVMIELGGFAPENVILHLGSTAEEVRDSLQRLERRIAARKGHRSLLFIYFSGHANHSALELGKTSLPFSWLRQSVNLSQANLRVAVIDACQSGQLVSSKGGSKGGKPGPGYDISLSDHMASQGYAIITSSTADELSQESEEIRGSTFTHQFLSALRGAGDDSGDDQVTLTEAYRYAYSLTVASTAANMGGGQHPMYDFKLSGRGDIVLTTPNKSVRSGLSFTSRTPGKLLVLSDDRERVVGEFAARSNTPVQIVLRPGGYWVYHIARGGIQRASVVVEANRFRQLADVSFSKFTPKTLVEKGGLFAHRPIHRIAGSLLLRRMPLEGRGLAYGAAVSYGVELSNDLQPSITITGASAADAGLSEGYYELGIHPGLSYTWLRFSRYALAAFAELRVGYEFLAQAARDQSRRYTSGFSYYGGAGVRFPIATAFWGQIAGGAGGRLFELRQSGWVHRLDLQLTTGIVWEWSSSR